MWCQQVMFADGTVSQYCQSSPLLPGSRSNSPQRVGSAKSDRETPTKKSGWPQYKLFIHSIMSLSLSVRTMQPKLFAVINTQFAPVKDLAVLFF